jgi:hypothetical protein
MSKSTIWLRLVMIGVVGIALSGLVLAGDDAKKAQSNLVEAKRRDAQNFKELALAMIEYSQDHRGELPPPAVLSKDRNPLLSWRVLLLPYLEQKELYQQFKLDEAWDSDHNAKLVRKMPKVFAAPRGGKPGQTVYQVFVGPEASFQPGVKRRFPASFVDGTSNTVMISEAAQAVPWTKPADLKYDSKRPLPKLGGQFPDGFHVATWDGAVHYFKKDFNPVEMRYAITPAGGEVIDFDKLERKR